MSGVSALMAEVHAAGATVSFVDGVVRIRARKGALTDAQCQRLFEHRAEIATLLAGAANDRAAAAAPAPAPAPADDDPHRVAALAGALADLSAGLERVRPPRTLRDDFDERAAVAEFDGGLTRVAAEQIALADAPGPIGEDAAAWRAWMTARYRSRLARAWFEADARSATWCEAEDVWHRRHAADPDPDHCAGCRGLFLDSFGMVLPDGARVHIGDDAGLDCMIRYGEQWRPLARAALIGLGVDDGKIFTEGTAP
jgi:hypothetical protein